MRSLVCYALMASVFLAGCVSPHTVQKVQPIRELYRQAVNMENTPRTTDREAMWREGEVLRTLSVDFWKAVVALRQEEGPDEARKLLVDLMGRPGVSIILIHSSSATLREPLDDDLVDQMIQNGASPTARLAEILGPSRNISKMDFYRKGARPHGGGLLPMN